MKPITVFPELGPKETPTASTAYQQTAGDLATNATLVDNRDLEVAVKVGSMAIEDQVKSSALTTEPGLAEDFKQMSAERKQAHLSLGHRLQRV